MVERGTTMKILITGGHTEVHIDKVRVISNIFKGKTALDITEAFYNAGHSVTLLGNEAMRERFKSIIKSKIEQHDGFLQYRTYEDLFNLMKKEITDINYDAIIHSAAISDYEVYSVRAHNLASENLIDGKVGSSYPKLYIELIPTAKIVDKIRKDWKFTGKLVKFKLEVGISDIELLSIAEKSRVTSGADFIVANCLEWCRNRAYIIGPSIQNGYVNVVRSDLPGQLLKVLGAEATCCG